MPKNSPKCSGVAKSSDESCQNICSGGLRPPNENRSAALKERRDFSLVLKNDFAVQEHHAGVIFVSSKSFAQNNHSILAKALVELARGELDADWTSRVLFLSKS